MSADTPTPAAVRRDPQHHIAGPGLGAAAQTDCAHGYRLTDSCPTCDTTPTSRLEATAVPDTPTPPETDGITDEAVEIAARTELEATWQGRVDWDSLDHDTQQRSLTAMRAALAAALPYLTADKNAELADQLFATANAMRISFIGECPGYSFHSATLEAVDELRQIAATLRGEQA